jgi:hypothetical protein
LQLPFRGKIKQWEDGKFDTVPMGSGEIASLMGQSELYGKAMTRTVNNLVEKLYLTRLKGIKEAAGKLAMDSNQLKGVKKLVDSPDLPKEENTQLQKNKAPASAVFPPAPPDRPLTTTQLLNPTPTNVARRVLSPP